jgi:hypothetical protein
MQDTAKKEAKSYVMQLYSTRDLASCHIKTPPNLHHTRLLLTLRFSSEK